MGTTKEIASEACHWYNWQGNPCYTIIGKNGKERATTLRDARKHGYVPSVTTVTGIYPKPGLTLWKMKNVLMSSLTLPRYELESDEAYITRIFLDADEQSKKAREVGTTVHGAIERRMLGLSYDEQYEQHVHIALIRLMDCIGYKGEIREFINQCNPEKSFTHYLGYGGKVDLHSRDLDFVCDFKTKDDFEDDKQLVWAEHKLQLAAYAEGLSMPLARRINVFVNVKRPEMTKAVIVENDIEDWMLFKDLLQVWKRINKYWPAPEGQA